MFRVALAWGLLFLLITQSVLVSGLKLWRQVDRESFTEFLCENIDKPQLDCWGECVLDDIQGISEGDDESSGSDFVLSSVPFKVLGTIPPDLYRFVVNFFPLQFTIHRYYLPKGFDPPSVLFRPPILG